MSFGGSISNALSGLRTSSLAAELVSSNLANATNENYATRSLNLSSRVQGGSGGVKADGVARDVNEALLGEWRRAQASIGELETRTSYLARVERLFGAPDEAGSLSSLMTGLETSLVSAAARPDLSNRLGDVHDSASALVDAFGSTASGLQSLRREIDAGIDRTVADLNSHLAQIVDINSRIGSARSYGDNPQALLDLRQAAIDKVAEIVPIRVMPRDNNSIALVTTSGAVLMDGAAVEVDFSPAGTVTEHMTLQNGQLSGLSVNGAEISVSGTSSRIKGGTLAALFEMRDDTLPRYQGELDALARNLVDQFQDSSLDPTIAPGDPGLFTDLGLAFAPADEVGLSRRLGLNPAIDPDAGGALWRLRDGLYAATPGPSGDGSLLLAMIDRLNLDQTVASGSQSGLSATAAELTTTVFSALGADLSRSENRLSYASARSAELTEQKLRDGVDTDTELQKLMQIEKAYAANAKVLQTIDEMLDVLMGIT